MSDESWRHVTLDDLDVREEKPGQRWELSPEIGIDAFNLNVAVLTPGERLSQNHFHYHEQQEELVYVAEGRCRIEVDGARFVAEQDDTVRFDAGRDGAHLVHNPFSEPARLVAIGWPPEGRYPVHQVATLDELEADNVETVNEIGKREAGGHNTGERETERDAEEAETEKRGTDES